MCNENLTPPQPKPTPQKLFLKGFGAFAVAGAALFFTNIMPPGGLGGFSNILGYAACVFGVLAGIGLLIGGIVALAQKPPEDNQTLPKPVSKPEPELEGGKKQPNQSDLEKQYALTLNASELKDIVAGNAVWTAVGYKQKVHGFSKEMAQQAIPVVKLIMEADQLVGRNDLDGALVRYQSALTKEPNCAIAHMAIGTVYSRKKDYASALKWTRIAAQLDPLNTRIGKNLEIAEENFEHANSGKLGEANKRSEAMVTAGIIRHVENKSLASVIPSILGGTGNDLYEVYEADKLIDAREFLLGVVVTEQQRYVVIETPEGAIGRDHSGIYTPSKNWRGNDWKKSL